MFIMHSFKRVLYVRNYKNGKNYATLAKKTICNGMGEGEVALYQYDLPGLFLLLSQMEDSINL